MMIPSTPAAMAAASQTNDSFQAALAYHKLGLSVMPLTGKRPALATWKTYQTQRASEDDLQRWQSKFSNVGIVCGAVSNNLVVLDLDGPGAYGAYAPLWPQLLDTFTVATGSGQGKHLYYFVDDLPEAVRAIDTPIGHLELRSDGCQIVAPPSVHPVTHKPYRVEKPVDVLRVPHLNKLVAWIESFKALNQPVAWQPPANLNGTGDAKINPAVIEAFTDTLRQGRVRQSKDWLYFPRSNGSLFYCQKHDWMPTT